MVRLVSPFDGTQSGRAPGRYRLGGPDIHESPPCQPPFWSGTRRRKPWRFWCAQSRRKL